MSGAGPEPQDTMGCPPLGVKLPRAMSVSRLLLPVLLLMDTIEIWYATWVENPAKAGIIVREKYLKSGTVFRAAVLLKPFCRFSSLAGMGFEFPKVLGR